MTQFVEYKIKQQTFTTAQLQDMVSQEKPYILELDKAIQDLKFGTIDLKLEVRAGEVEKMSFFQTKNWLRPKEGHLQC